VLTEDNIMPSDVPPYPTSVKQKKETRRGSASGLDRKKYRENLKKARQSRAEFCTVAKDTSLKPPSMESSSVPHVCCGQIHAKSTVRLESATISTNTICMSTSLERASSPSAIHKQCDCGPQCECLGCVIHPGPTQKLAKETYEFVDQCVYENQLGQVMCTAHGHTVEAEHCSDTSYQVGLCKNVESSTQPMGDSYNLTTDGYLSGSNAPHTQQHITGHSKWWRNGELMNPQHAAPQYYNGPIRSPDAGEAQGNYQYQSGMHEHYLLHRTPLQSSYFDFSHQHVQESSPNNLDHCSPFASPFNLPLPTYGASYPMASRNQPFTDTVTGNTEYGPASFVYSDEALPTTYSRSPVMNDHSLSMSHCSLPTKGCYPIATCTSPTSNGCSQYPTYPLFLGMEAGPQPSQFIHAPLQGDSMPNQTSTLPSQNDHYNSNGHVRGCQNGLCQCGDLCPCYGCTTHLGHNEEEDPVANEILASKAAAIYVAQNRVQPNPQISLHNTGGLMDTLSPDPFHSTGGYPYILDWHTGLQPNRAPSDSKF